MFTVKVSDLNALNAVNSFDKLAKFGRMSAGLTVSIAMLKHNLVNALKEVNQMRRTMLLEHCETDKLGNPKVDEKNNLIFKDEDHKARFAEETTDFDSREVEVRGSRIVVNLGKAGEKFGVDLTPDDILVLKPVFDFRYTEEDGKIIKVDDLFGEE